MTFANKQLAMLYVPFFPLTHDCQHLYDLDNKSEFYVFLVESGRLNLQMT